MKCLVCGSELEDQVSVCSRCKFPVIYTTGSSEADLAQIRQMAQNYRNAKFSPAKIYFSVYSYRKKTATTIQRFREDKLLLGIFSDLKKDAILWYPEKFARTPGSVKLKMSIEAPEMPPREVAADIERPCVEDFWMIGIQAGSGLDFRIVVGTPNSYQSSKMISILE